MTEDRTTIQNRMLSGIPEEYDTTEGSFFYDVVKPMAIELEAAYGEADTILSKGFAETASGEWLDKKAAEQGIYRKQPTKATIVVIITGSEGTTVHQGDKVASDTVAFLAKETKTIGPSEQVEVLVECEVYGSAGNVPKGAIKYFPVTLSGLTGVINPEVVSNGYPGETDEELRQRYFDKVRTPSTSGNKHHYKNWAKEIAGVGDVKVFPLAEGSGTVRVVIISNDKTGADQQLVEQVANHIEELRPIGASVTLESAVEVPIFIKASFILDNNYTLEEAQVNMEEKVKEHFRSIAFSKSYISYAILGSVLIETEGIMEYSDLNIGAWNTSISDINWGMENIPIHDDQVPVLGGITFE